jgi:hypothetical protein
VLELHRRAQSAVVTKPVPNFTRLDPSRPEIAILMDAMLRAREVVAARSWSTSQEPTCEHWWADVLADPRARQRRVSRGLHSYSGGKIVERAYYTLADEPGINPNFQGAEAQSRELQEAGRVIGRPIQIVDAGNDQELEAAFVTLGQRGAAAALLVAADPFFVNRRDRIVALAAQLKLPAIYEVREYADAGGLMSYGISLKDGYHQVGVYTGQILKGAKPADLPVHQSSKFEFVINLRTAKALGVKFSDNMLTLADEMIE